MKRKLLAILLVILAPIVNAQTINTVAGNGSSGYSGDGVAATSTKLFSPTGVAVDALGNLYIADFDNNRVRKVDVNTHIITTVVGTGVAGFFGDGGPATTAKLQNPYAIAFDDSGNLYIADNNNNRIRKVTAATGIINTIAGNGNSVFSGDGIPATSSSLGQPNGLAVDDSGNVYISDYDNHRIRKVTAATGIISTVAGNGTVGSSGDNGPGSSSEIHDASGIAVDKAGNLYIADRGNSRIRKVDKSTGIITTIAGTTLNGGFSGDGGPAVSAELKQPFGVAVDAAGNIIIADYLNYRIRKITTSTGVITTIAGKGFQGYGGDGGPADSAEFNGLSDVATDGWSNIYIADLSNNRIRSFNEFPDGINEVAVSNEVNMYPVPTTGEMIVELNGNGYKSIRIYDITGRELYSQLLNAGLEDASFPINIGNVPNGVYIMQIMTEKGIVSGKVVKE